MSVSNTVKDEILSQRIIGDCCRNAFIAGVISGCGSLPIERGGFGLILQHSSEELITKCAALLLQLTGKEPEIVKKDKEMSLGQRIVYEVRLGANIASPLLANLGIFQPPYGIKERASEDIISLFCCKKTFLRGVFCAAGSLNLSGDCQTENSKGYNLDISLTSIEAARFLADVMESLGIQPGVRAIKNNYAVYLKDSEKISDLFIALGANSALYTLNNIVASRSLRNDANRRTNCEVANIDKTLSASAKQLEAITLIESRVGLGYLDEFMQDTAEVRKAYPDASLNDMLSLLRFPTSKSGLNHRLRKLIQIANELRGEYD